MGIKLVETRHSRVLYKSKPFQAFIGDCTSCSHFEETKTHYNGLGYCKKRKVFCGEGYTCKKNDSRYKVSLFNKQNKRKQ